MHAFTLLLAAASLASVTVAQSSSTVLATSEISDGPAQAPTTTPGTMTIGSFSADPPGYTFSWVDTATMPAFSAPPSYTSSMSSVNTSTSYVVPTQPGTKYNSTYVPMPIVTASRSPASNYTMVTSSMPVPSTLSVVSSVAVAATSTGPSIPISSTNAAAVRRVAGTGLALVAAGSLFAVLL
jgi:hypothetical protein